MSENRLLGCSCITGESSATLSLTTIASQTIDNELTAPAKLHIQMSRAQVDNMVLALQRISAALGEGTS